MDAFDLGEAKGMDLRRAEVGRGVIGKIAGVIGSAILEPPDAIDGAGAFFLAFHGGDHALIGRFDAGQQRGGRIGDERVLFRLRDGKLADLALEIGEQR